jgi:peroxiredoxin (alkyl hydroperoxide reductase subunit C)
MSVLVGKKAPVFSSKAVVNGNEIVDDFSLAQYKGKNMYIFLLSCRFYFCIPTE